MKKFFPIILTIITILSLSGSVFVLYLYFDQQRNFEVKQQQYVQQIELEKTRAQAQRQSKNDVRSEWEKQLVMNDELVSTAVLVQDAAAAYLKNADQKSPLESALKNLDTLLDKNAEAKQNTRDQVEKIYQRDGEDQQNRANPDGIR